MKKFYPVIDKTTKDSLIVVLRGLIKQNHICCWKHRDITLDSALCNNAITENGHETAV